MSEIAEDNCVLISQFVCALCTTRLTSFIKKLLIQIVISYIRYY